MCSEYMVGVDLVLDCDDVVARSIDINERGNK